MPDAIAAITNVAASTWPRRLPPKTVNRAAPISGPTSRSASLLVDNEALRVDEQLVGKHLLEQSEQIPAGKPMNEMP